MASTDQNYRWVDLDGEGLSGILTEQGGSWFYKANLSPANVQGAGPTALTFAQFAPVRLVDKLPVAGRVSTPASSSCWRCPATAFFRWSSSTSPTPGYFERTQDVRLGALPALRIAASRSTGRTPI